jgi:hypothetical protein
MDNVDDDEVVEVGRTRGTPAFAREANAAPMAFLPLAREPCTGLNDEIFPLLQCELLSTEVGKALGFVRGCSVTFFEQRTPYTCTYASLMMLVSALLSIPDRCYRIELFQGFGAVPDVISIQRLLEDAWRRGYDVEGSVHFGGRIVGKEARIGPSDVCALLRASKVPVRVFDFDYGSDSYATVVHVLRGLFADEDAPVVFPFILGDAKHTVLVVGVTDEALIVLNPSTRCENALRLIRTHNLRAFLQQSWPSQQFQLLVVGPCASEHPEWTLHETSNVKYGGKVLLATRPPRVDRMQSRSRSPKRPKGSS